LISGSWQYPLILAADATQGSEKRQLSISLSRSLAATDLNAKYDLLASRFLPGETFSTVHSASINLRVNEFALLGLGFVPVLNLDFEAKEGTVAWDGRANVRVNLDALSAQVSYQKTMLQVPQGQLQYNEYSDRFVLTFGYTGIPYLNPSLSYTGSANIAIYKGEPRSSANHLVSARLAWAPQGGYRNDLSLAVRFNEGDEITASVQEAFSYNISPYASARFDLDARYKIIGATMGNSLSLTFGGTVNYRLSDSWRTSLTVSYIAGETDTVKFYHSTLFELFVAVKF